jgi:hypothetical protein
MEPIKWSDLPRFTLLFIADNGFAIMGFAAICGSFVAARQVRAIQPLLRETVPALLLAPLMIAGLAVLSLILEPTLLPRYAIPGTVSVAVATALVMDVVTPRILSYVALAVVIGWTTARLQKLTRMEEVNSQRDETTLSLATDLARGDPILFELLDDAVIAQHYNHGAGRLLVERDATPVDVAFSNEIGENLERIAGIPRIITPETLTNSPVKRFIFVRQMYSEPEHSWRPPSGFVAVRTDGRVLEVVRQP